jgi:outer membrane immunogenic protein
MKAIKRRLCAAGLALGITSPAALAADVAFPVKAPPPAVAYNWTGFYIGAHGGYGGGMKDWRRQEFVFEAHGALAGGQVGVNQQIGNWVIGIEVDAAWTDIDGGQTSRSGGPSFTSLRIASASSHVDWLVTATGRIGFAADRWLVYVKGGAAWAHESHTFDVNVNVFTAPGPGIIAQSRRGDDDRFGAVLGFGAEYGFAPNWSAKIEYNYILFGLKDVTMAGTLNTFGAVTPLVGNFPIEQSLHLVKAGINYRFGGFGAQIAPSAPAPGFDWTGVYVGAQGGYGFGRKEWSEDDFDSRYDVDGWLIGGTAGVNAQAGVFVAGVEAEWMWTRLTGGASKTVPGLPGQLVTTAFSTRVDWLALASARIGFVAADRWLVYAKGGVAVAHEDHALDTASVVAGATSTTQSMTGNRLHAGLLAGFGIEYAFLGNWSAKLEYNYLAFAHQRVSFNGIAILPAVGQADVFQTVGVRQDMHLVKLGVNYHFNPLSHVIAAKY